MSVVELILKLRELERDGHGDKDAYVVIDEVGDGEDPAAGPVTSVELSAPVTGFDQVVEVRCD